MGTLCCIKPKDDSIFDITWLSPRIRQNTACCFLALSWVELLCDEHHAVARLELASKFSPSSCYIHKQPELEACDRSGRVERIYN
jgi:hypothetical protein